MNMILKRMKKIYVIVCFHWHMVQEYLLHQTPLKLKVGRTYGILGSNGAGKSTLMRAMVSHTLQNFPLYSYSIF
jgi:ATPase subunit of ABC transporter with duplicated ATPase domains